MNFLETKNLSAVKNLLEFKFMSFEVGTFKMFLLRKPTLKHLEFLSLDNQKVEDMTDVEAAGSTRNEIINFNFNILQLLITFESDDTILDDIIEKLLNLFSSDGSNKLIVNRQFSMTISLKSLGMLSL